MRNYSVIYLDKGGRTLRTEYSPFEDDHAAIQFGRIGVARHDIIEIWKDTALVERLYHEPPVSQAPGFAALSEPRQSTPNPSPGGTVAQWDKAGDPPAAKPAPLS